MEGILSEDDPPQSAEATRKLASFVHDVSGTADVVGYTQLGNLARSISHFGRTHGWDDATVNRDELRPLVDRFRVEVAARG